MRGLVHILNRWEMASAAIFGALIHFITKSNFMDNNKNGSIIFEVALAALDGNVRLDLRMSMKDALIFVLALEQAVAPGEGAGTVRRLLKEEDMARIEEIKKQVLAKAKLEQVYSKLREYMK
jgi:hypothetical protein